MASLLPWWLCLILAVAFCFAFHRLSLVKAPTPKDVAELGRSVQWSFAAVAGQYLQYIAPAIFGMGAIVSAINRRKLERLHDDVRQRKDKAALFEMNWQQFEQLTGEYFRRRGFEVTETNAGKGGADGGIDLVLRKGGDRYLVQCKQWRANRVGVEIVRELFGLMAAQGAAGGYVVTSGRFAAEAKAFSDGRSIELIDGDALKNGIDNQPEKLSPALNRRMPPMVEAAKPSNLRTVMPSVLSASRAELPSQPELPARSSEATASPGCPKCGSRMVKREAKRGPKVGSEFWGCSAYSTSGCTGVRPA